MLTSMQKVFFNSNYILEKVVPFKLAELGEGIVEVEVLKWFVKPGDEVAAFDNLCEVQSDKAAVTITSKWDGKIANLHYQKGQIAKVGTPLCDMDIADSIEVKETPKAAEAPKAEAPKAAEAPAPAPKVETPAPAPAQPTISTKSTGTVLASPYVRGIAKAKNIDLNLVHGTGKWFNNITCEDLDAFLAKPAGAAPAHVGRIPSIQFKYGVRPARVAHAPAASVEETPASGKSQTRYEMPAIHLLPDDVVEPVRGLKRTMIKTMSLATQVPSMGVFDDYYVDNLIQVRDSLKPMALAKGLKLSYTPFFIKAASLAMKEFPIINSTLSNDHKDIIFHKAHNISIAMDTPSGLIVPNIKHCETKSIFEIAAELKRLGDLATQGKLTGDDLKYGTFTISNIGAIGGATYVRPILMPHESCIVALSDFKKYPRMNEKTNQFVVRNVMHVSWSCDHRTIEGATLLRFSNKLKSYIENPLLMMGGMN